MFFNHRYIIQESNYKQLYSSSDKAFPRTQKRQHVVHEISIENLNYTPFVGVKTLFVKFNVINEENKNQYKPMILFKNVNYAEKMQENFKQIFDITGKKYFIERLSLNKDVVLRCNCPDFRWRFAYYDHLDKSLYGNKPPKYESKGILPPVNPKKMPGICKHLMASFMHMVDNNILY